MRIIGRIWQGRERLFTALIFTHIVRYTILTLMPMLWGRISLLIGAYVQAGNEYAWCSFALGHLVIIWQVVGVWKCSARSEALWKWLARATLLIGLPSWFISTGSAVLQVLRP